MGALLLLASDHLDRATAIVRERRALWASIADSHLYRVAGANAVRMNVDLTLFAGGEPELHAVAHRVGLDTVVEWGDFDLVPNETLLLASDGIGFEDSGLH